MIDLDSIEQTWLIEQFLRGNLPASVQEQVVRLMESDAAFRKRVMAQWLVTNYLDEQREVDEFYREWDSIAIAASARKPYTKHLVVSYLPQLLYVAAVLVVCVGLAFWGFFRTESSTPRITTLPIEVDEEQYGFSGTDDSVVVVRYGRLPHFWQFGRRYTWVSDTLTVYGLPESVAPTETWRIGPTSARSEYRLEIDGTIYKVYKPQPTLTPLKADETP